MPRSEKFDPGVGPPKGPPKAVVAWNSLVTKALGQNHTGSKPSTGVFVSDSELKSLLKERIHAKNCPTTFVREDLVRYAIQLGLINEDDSKVVAPKKNPKQPKTWKQFVELVSFTRFRPEPESSDPSRVFATEELITLLEAYIGEGQRVPQDCSRRVLLEQSVQVGLISQSQADNPLPDRLTDEELSAKWKEYAKDRKDRNLAKVTKPSGVKNLIALLSSEGKISLAQAEGCKVTRPDFALKIQSCRQNCERTRSFSLSSLLKGIKNADTIKQTLARLSDESSKLFYERGFFIWLHLHRLVTENLPLPDMHGDRLDRFIRRSYTINTQNSHLDPNDNDIKEMENTYKKYEIYFPTKTRPNSVNLITHAANSYAGAMVRHFCNMDTVTGRIKRFVAARLSDLFVQINHGEDDLVDEDVSNMIRDRKKDVGSNPIYNVTSAIEDISFNVNAMHPLQREVLIELRKELNLPEGVQLNERWLRANIHDSIRFAFRVVCTLDDVREEMMSMHNEIDSLPEQKRPKLKSGLGRGLSFVPLNGQRRRYVTLDATDLMDIFDLKKVDESLVSDIVGSLFGDNITNVLNEDYTLGKKGNAPKWHFTGTMDTDGISSANLHFRRAKSQSEIEDADKRKKINKKEADVPLTLDTPPRLLLLVDPGRINLIVITVMLDSKVVMVNKKTSKGPGVKVPLKFVFSTKQYRNMMGVVKREIIRKGREARADLIGKKDPNYEAKKFRDTRSNACLKTGNVNNILKYMKASIDFPVAADQLWKRHLGKKASWDMWRSRMMKDRAINRWLFEVKRKVHQLTGEKIATVVWGCKVASTGKGTLSAPTDRVAMLAKMIPDWNVVNGDEYNSSKRSFVEPHSENMAPRFLGTPMKKKTKMKRTVCSQVRHGFIQSLDSKRMIFRNLRGKKTTRIGKTGNKKYKDVVKWTYDGHANQIKILGYVNSTAGKRLLWFQENGVEYFN